MARRLPPLNALRAFEAAARHLSFTRAAEELFVTQAAVSHQVKALEEHLGRQLFRRLNRALLLTDDGQAYLPSLSRAFTLIDDATRDLLTKGAPGPLTVSALPSFAARWLAMFGLSGALAGSAVAVPEGWFDSVELDAVDAALVERPGAALRHAVASVEAGETGRATRVEPAHSSR